MVNPPKQFQGMNITFNTGESCNLACKYCYETHKRDKALSLDKAKAFIDLLYSKDDYLQVGGTKDSWIYDNGAILDFIGGDSLMEVDLVEDILKYWVATGVKLKHRWAFNWRASLSTNGTILTPKVKKFLIKYKDVLSLGLSIDGNHAMHDANRIFPNGKGSLDTIIKNLPWFQTYYPNIGTKSTLAKNSIPHIYDSLVFMHETLGLTVISQNFIFEDMHLEKKDLLLLDKQLEKCVAYTLEHRQDLYWGMLDQRFLNPKSYKESMLDAEGKNFCGSGLMPALSPNGSIYPCFRFLPHTMNSKIDMSVGNIKDGFSKSENFRKIRACTKDKISPEKCKNCEFEGACAWCIAGGFSETGGPVRQTYICEITKLQVKWAKIYWDEYVRLEGSMPTPFL